MALELLMLLTSIMMDLGRWSDRSILIGNGDGSFEERVSLNAGDTGTMISVMRVREPLPSVSF